MNIVKPYLVQRCVIKPSIRHDKKISENLETEYMGSAEFEFGALPKSLRRINEDLNKFHVIQVQDIKDEQNRPLIVWLKFPFEQVPTYVEYLKQMREGNIHLKESSAFNVGWKVFNTYSKTDFWWDIDNDVMFSFNPEIMKVLPDSIRVSIKFMNKQKEKQ